MDKKLRTKLFKQKAEEAGFLLAGISRAGFMNDEARRLELWLNKNYHGEMSYMANHFDKRVDPALLVPGARSVISLAYNYYNPQMQEDPEAPIISMYAYGKDYHKVVKKKLKVLYHWLRAAAGDISGRYFVDSAPVLERDWARRSGLGWIGKNTMLINPKIGSYFFLAEIITDLEMEYDAPIRDHCGTCTKCIEACPTDAIDENGYLMDGSKCISYATIELKSDIPEGFKGRMENRVFGCDICQDVCPWNRFSKPHAEPEFLPEEPLMKMTRDEWNELTEDGFNLIFNGSAVKRAGFEGLKRNIRFLNEH